MESVESLSIAVIGAGGCTSWLMAPLKNTFRNSRIKIFDGDILEERNLERQFFREDQTGTNKAEALAQLHGLEFDPKYFVFGMDIGYTDLIICCVDNHIARKEVLNTCDSKRIPCVIGANEYYDHQAYWYDPLWKDTPKDPRIRYPEINTDMSGNPITCTGLMQEASPQLCLANFNAAGLILKLMWLHLKIAPFLDRDLRDKVPFEFRYSKYKSETLTGENYGKIIPQT